jgi:hypothetical protein
VAVAAAKGKKRKANSGGWGFRLAGIVLCAFFALGVMTGLSRPGRTLALRFQNLLSLWPHSGHSAIIPPAFFGGTVIEPVVRPRTRAAAVALVRRADGFYALDSDGDLNGPVAPAAEGDMPILSGTGAESADSSSLIECAGVLVRAEANLGAIVSELRLDPDGTATMFLDRPHIGIVFDFDRAGAELARAIRILGIWRGHESMIALIDLTTANQAVVRLRPPAVENARSAPALRKTAYALAPATHTIRGARGDSARP